MFFNLINFCLVYFIDIVTSVFFLIFESWSQPPTPVFGIKWLHQHFKILMRSSFKQCNIWLFYLHHLKQLFIFLCWCFVIKNAIFTIKSFFQVMKSIPLEKTWSNWASLLWLYLFIVHCIQFYIKVLNFYEMCKNISKFTSSQLQKWKANWMTGI